MSELYCSQNDETVPFAALAAEIGIKLPLVAEPIINAAIFRAATDFLSKSRLLKETITVPFQRFTKDYPLETSDCNSILSIEAVRLGGVPVEGYEPVGSSWVKLPDCVLDTCDGTVLEVDVILSLSRNSCELPKFVYERFGKGLINIVLSDLYGMYGEDWYDAQMVRFYGGLGKQSIDDAKSLIQFEKSRESVPIVGSGLIV